MKNNIKTWLCTTAAVAALASSAYAVPTDALRYSIDGGSTWTTIADNASGDVNSSDNNITALINGGGFNLVVTIGFNSGTAGKPDMDLHVAGTTTGSGGLIVEYSDINFGPVPTGAYNTSFFVNNGAGASASERTIIGANSLFAGANTPLTGGIGPIGPFTTGSGTSSASVPGQSDPYSITLVQVLTSSGAGNSISTDAHLSVPDGGNTFMLLGSALSVLGLGVFRNARKSAVKA
jgi:hypothetical protein